MNGKYGAHPTCGGTLMGPSTVHRFLFSHCSSYISLSPIWYKQFSSTTGPRMIPIINDTTKPTYEFNPRRILYGFDPGVGKMGRWYGTLTHNTQPQKVTGGEGATDNDCGTWRH